MCEDATVNTAEVDAGAVRVQTVKQLLQKELLGGSPLGRVTLRRVLNQRNRYFQMGRNGDA